MHPVIIGHTAAFAISCIILMIMGYCMLGSSAPTQAEEQGSSNGGFLIYPEPAQVQEGEVGEFNCSVMGFAVWLINGSRASDDRFRDLNISYNTSTSMGITTSVLYIPATVGNNNTQISCCIYVPIQCTTISSQVTLTVFTKDAHVSSNDIVPWPAPSPTESQAPSVTPHPPGSSPTDSVPTDSVPTTGLNDINLGSSLVEKHIITVKELIGELEDVTDWEGLALQLDVPQPKVDEIANDCWRNIPCCKRKLAIFWLRDWELEPSWEKIAVALEKMNLRRQAASVRQKATTAVSKDPDNTDEYPSGLFLMRNTTHNTHTYTPVEMNFRVTITQSGNNVTAIHEGEGFTINCEVGYTYPELAFEISGPTTRVFRKIDKGRNLVSHTSIEITNASVSDSGIYSCGRVINFTQNGRITPEPSDNIPRWNLTVYRRPSITGTAREPASPTSHVTFTCHVECSVYCNITWQHNGTTLSITAGGRYQYSTGLQYKLIVELASPQSDSGIYTCTVNTDYLINETYRHIPFFPGPITQTSDGTTMKPLVLAAIVFAGVVLAVCVILSWSWGKHHKREWMVSFVQKRPLLQMQDEVACD